MVPNHVCMIRRTYPTLRAITLFKLHGVATILALVLACAQSLAAGGAETLENRLVPVEKLAEGYSFKLARGASGHRLISVSQLEADVELQVTDSQGRRWTFDAPGRRAGPERARVFDDGRGLTIDLRSRERTGNSGKALRLVVTIERGGELQAEFLESRAAQVSGAAPERTPVKRATDYQLAGKIWETRGNPARAGYAYLQSGWMLARRTSDHPLALARGQQARDAFRAAHDDVGAALSVLQMTVPRTELISSGLDAMGQKAAGSSALPDALHADLKAAVAAFDTAGLVYFGAQARIQLAASYQLRNDLDTAISLLGEAVKRYEAVGAADGAARALANRCFMLYQRGDYGRAAKAFDEVLRGGATVDFPDVRSDILDNSATTQAAAGNFDKALPQFVAALSIHESLKDIPGMARSLNGLASTYLSLGNYRAAIAYARRAQNVLQKRDDAGRLVAEPVRLNSLLIEGVAHRELGEFAAAEAAHRSVLEIANGAKAEFRIARAHLELARDAVEQGDGARALALIDAVSATVNPAWGTLPQQLRLRRSAALLISGKPDLAIAELSPFRGQFKRLGAPEFELELLEVLGRAQLAGGKIREGLATSSLGIAQLKALRLVSGNPEMRARLNDVYRSTYALRVELLRATREQVKDAAAKQRLQSQIFAAADEARAGLARAAPVSSVERDPLAAEISLRQSLLSGLEANGGNTERAAVLHAELASLRARFDAAAAWSDSPLPAFEESDYSLAALRGDAVVLMYLQSAGELHRYVITRNSIRELEARPLALVRRRAEAAIRELGVAPSAVRAHDAVPALLALSEVLMPPPELLDGRRQLIVVGDSVLARIPFSALSSTAREYSPVILAHDLIMALTLRDALVIATLDDRAQRVDLTRMALFFDPVFTALDDRVTVKKRSADDVLLLPRLSGTAAEARAIQATLPAANVTAFSGFAATRDALLSAQAASATVLHLATHAIANDRWPNGSGLMLSALKPGGEIINGYVSTLDLLARRSSTQLVVLSACDTARGESGASETVAGLARAVLGGGSRRVVASQWAVDDSITARIMGEFYRRLAAGDSAARALSAAQRAIYADSRLRSPARWAAFVVYERAPGD